MVTYVPQFSMSLESGHTLRELLVWLCRSSTRANGLPIWGWFLRSILEYHYDTIETSLIIPMMSSKKPTLRIVTSWLFSKYSHTKSAKNGTCRISLSKKKNDRQGSDFWYLNLKYWWHLWWFQWCHNVEKMMSMPSSSFSDMGQMLSGHDNT